MPHHLHIVCFDVPYPADYGGVFDVFYKIVSLHQAGVQIHLHCFEYGKRKRQKELEKYCVLVQYYKRKTTFSFTLPYIVVSRKNEDLFSCLLQDDYPILMEGVHSSYLLLDKRFAGRKLFIRLHNTEFVYYHYLYKHSSHLFKKLYYFTESILLKSYERRIAKKEVVFWAMSLTDVQLYQQYFGCNNIFYLPLFVPAYWQVKCKEGFGTYCLYQGKLEVDENEKAVNWLLENVFANLTVPFIIAGKNPSSLLIKKIAQYKQATLIADVSEEEMEKLIAGAHIHILPSFNATGIKIKLLNALFNGRHCMINSATAEGTQLSPLCYISNTPSEMQITIQQLFTIPFSFADIKKRKEILCKEFNNKNGAEEIVNWL